MTYTPYRINCLFLFTQYLRAYWNKITGYSPFFIISKIIVALFGWQLAGCTSLPRSEPAFTHQAANTNAASSTRHYQSQLQINGRLNLRYMEHDKEQLITANYEWQQDGDNTDIALISPTGQILAKISQNRNGARLEQANQPPREAEHIEALLQSQLGWYLPIAGLRDWMQGYYRNAAQNYQAVPADDDARLTVDGWQLRYATWQREQDTPHPKKIELQRNDREVGDIFIKLVIDEWNTP